MAGGQLCVDLKLKITTYGSHNGMIIHSGVQHTNRKPNSASGIWPYKTSMHSKIPSPVEFTEGQLALQDKHSEPIAEVQSPINTQPASGLSHSLSSLNPAFDEFNKPNKAELNISHTQQPESSSYSNCYNSTAINDPATVNDYLNPIQPPGSYGTRYNHLDIPTHSKSYSNYGNQQLTADVPSACETENRKPSPQQRSHKFISEGYNENFEAQSWSVQEDSRNQHRLPLGSSKQWNNLQYPLSDSLNRSDTNRNARSRSIPRNAKSEESFHLYQTRDALGNIRYECEDDFSENEIGMELINTDENPKESGNQYDHETKVQTSASEKSVDKIKELQKAVEDALPFARLPTYEELILATNKNFAVPKNCDMPSKESKDTEVDASRNKHSVKNRYNSQKWLTETYIFNSEHQKDDSEGQCEKSGFKTEDEAPPMSPIDLNAVPSKPILQCYRRPSRKDSLRKSVRFPPAQPKVVAEDHRLLITELDLSEIGS